MYVCVSVCLWVCEKLVLRIYLTDFDKIWFLRVFREYLQALFYFLNISFYFLAALRRRHRGSVVIAQKIRPPNVDGFTRFTTPRVRKSGFLCAYICLCVCLSVCLCKLISQDLLDRLGWNFVSGSFLWIQLGVFFIFGISLFLRVATLQKKIVVRIFSKTAL